MMLSNSGTRKDHSDVKEPKPYGEPDPPEKESGTASQEDGSGGFPGPKGGGKKQ